MRNSRWVRVAGCVLIAGAMAMMSVDANGQDRGQRY